jgi:hypothetical protein
MEVKMDKESLKIARKILLEGLDRAKMNPQDRAELLINLWNLLEDENYEHDIDVLKRYGKCNDRRKRK